MKTMYGVVTGTGASIEVECGAKPSRVKLYTPNMGVRAEWNNKMADGSLRWIQNGELDYLLNRCELSIGTSSDKALKVGYAFGEFDGVKKAKASAEVAFTATSHDVTKSKWGSFRVSMAVSGTVTLTVSAAVDHATEALAIAGLAATPANEISLGYITLKAGDSVNWDATGHSLAGGGTSPAAETNYYDGEPSNVITTGGITPTDDVDDDFRGFKIGANADINVAGYGIEWEAYFDLEV